MMNASAEQALSAERKKPSPLKRSVCFQEIFVGSWGRPLVYWFYEIIESFLNRWNPIKQWTSRKYAWLGFDPYADGPPLPSR